MKKNEIFLNLLAFVLSFLLLAACGNILTTSDNSNLSSFFKTFQLGQIESENWPQVSSAIFNDRCAAVVTDFDGNVYCGGFTQSEFFDTNPTNSQDILVFKISQSGELLWVNQIGESTTTPGGDTSGDDNCIGIDTFGDGVYCVGSTNSSLGHVGSGTECFIVKLSTETGQISWLRQISGFSCNGVGVDSTGVYVGGGTGSDLAEANGGASDVAIVKLDHEGNDIWIRQLGAISSVPGNTSGTESCRDLATDKNGGIYCGGTTRGSLGEVNGGTTDIFMAKFDSSGALLWLSQLGAINAPNSGNDICWSVAINANGPVCGGRTTGSMGDINSNTNVVDTLVAHFDKDDGSVRWIHQIGANSTIPIAPANNGSGVCDEVATDNENNIYCGGRTASSIIETNAGGNDVLLYKLSPSGEFQWGIQIGEESAPNDASGNDTIFGMTTYENIIISAGDTDGSLFEPNAGASDLFIFISNTEGEYFFSSSQ